ncbi:MAG: insulinase family protein [Bacteroidales bacterium]|nr:insulinase family protein [Bacteroidales bacterium]
MKRFFLLILAVCTLTLCSTAQDLKSAINNDPNVRIGKLENGLTYYIRANKKPENRIEFRLAVNAGSNQENEDQRGLAHFTEHMAFNGIKGFPHNTMIDQLQKIGVTFGVGINAYTSFDETVFEITMPTDNKKNVDMGLNILYGWSCGLLYDSKEIDAERGVISEEYRMGLGASDRMRKEWWPVLFQGSRYAERMPIGLIEIIQNFPYQTIKDFYHDWYRPDLQAVIVVGDVNVDEMEQMIIKRFSKNKMPKNPRVKEDYPITPNNEPLIAVCTDKEASGSTVMIIRKHPHFVMKTVNDYRTKMMYDLYNTMVDGRLNEMQQNPDCPFIGAAIGYGELIGSTDAYEGYAAAKEGKIIESIQSLMQEDYRILKHGFVMTELTRAKAEMLDQYERAAKEVNKTESAVFASEYVSHYLHHDPIPGAKRELTYAKKYLDDITLDEINALAEKWITDNNLVVIVTAPESDEVVVPTKDEILMVIKDKGLAEVEPYVDTYKEQEIVEKEKLTPGSILSKKEIAEIGATELTLSNGIKVILKKTDYKNDEIYFTAKSKGGTSLYNENELSSAAHSADFVDRSGINELNYSSLNKKLKGKKIELMPYVSTLEEGLIGSTSPKDMDYFFQYLNAFFTAPRYDTNAAKLVINEEIEQMKMIKASPMYKFVGELFNAITQKDPYQGNVLTYDEDFIKEASAEKAFSIYSERFGNAADFTFVFVGNFEEAAMEEMLNTYVASLPTNINRENFRGSVIREFPANTITKDVYAGQEEQSWVGIAFSQKYPYNYNNNLLISVIDEALQIELLATIREKMSGVYSPMLQVNYEKYPISTYSILIMFSCSPDNTDNLANACFKILNDFKANGPEATTLAKVKEQMIKNHETSLQKNGNWCNYILGKYYYDSTEDFAKFSKYNESINAITSADIVNFMKDFDVNHFVRMNLYPEKMKK